jgi:opacity protein-like surface antigen
VRNGALSFLAAGLVIGAAVAPPVRAADFEITPFAGYTMGGYFTDEATGATLGLNNMANYGFMLDMKDIGDSWFEFYFSRQETRLKANPGSSAGSPQFDVDVEYFHVGGTYGTSTERLKPFIVGTIGATYMDPRGPGLNSETKFSLSLGGGIKMFLTDRLGIRLDARWFGTFVGGGGAVFCSGGSCLINFQGDLWSQGVANAGVVVAF